MNKNQHISVLLMGGLGNQVFQFSFASGLKALDIRLQLILLTLQNLRIMNHYHLYIESRYFQLNILDLKKQVAS